MILTKDTRILRVSLFGYAMSRFSKMPEPPYYAVIFANQASKTPEGYAEMAAAMGEIAKTLPGYIGIESTRDADGFAITVSYWESEEAIKGWRKHAKHAIAQKIGKERWYEDYILRVAKVERQYSFK
ncbi:putative enzyme involved in biosynthesis of extracellular polysaccharides [Rhodobacteraceae bacterium HIMB11]|nr:putative enzyme involved in biosynthesis of extracellular polysaccharides [Rhodobacteraceae bacterium HIMB11]